MDLYPKVWNPLFLKRSGFQDEKTLAEFHEHIDRENDDDLARFLNYDDDSLDLLPKCAKDEILEYCRVESCSDEQTPPAVAWVHDTEYPKPDCRERIRPSENFMTAFKLPERLKEPVRKHFRFLRRASQLTRFVL
jgi:hypothetical protein